MLRRSSPMLGAMVPLCLSGAGPRAAWCEGRDTNDRGVIEGVARDYLEGWYAGDIERLGRALHPDLVKRYVDALPGGRQVVRSATREMMIELTRMGGGSKAPGDAHKVSVEVLEVSGDIAVARATSSEYLEYVSLAKANGNWVIVNILWRSLKAGSR